MRKNLGYPARKKKKRTVKRLTKLIEKSRNYLICITDDREYPDGLKKLISEKNWPASNVGWLSYHIFREIANIHNFEIQGTGSHIWIEKGIRR